MMTETGPTWLGMIVIFALWAVLFGLGLYVIHRTTEPKDDDDA